MHWNSPSKLTGTPRRAAEFCDPSASMWWPTPSISKPPLPCVEEADDEEEEEEEEGEIEFVEDFDVEDDYEDVEGLADLMNQKEEPTSSSNANSKKKKKRKRGKEIEIEYERETEDATL
mmetsp:Transcript_29783/g.47763  ORF Transcript_29783/g.47763 Transcript_29783/m.47763 type:complete len:119 (+) Transcript_29783:1538-1894(+)